MADFGWSYLAGCSGPPDDDDDDDDDCALPVPTEEAKLAAATPLTDFTATGIAEGFIDCDEDRKIQAWQHLIDTGLAWTLQGWFGRTARDLIANGVCTEAIDCCDDDDEGGRS